MSKCIVIQKSGTILREEGVEEILLLFSFATVGVLSTPRQWLPPEMITGAVNQREESGNV